jgi:hypothetical protein
MPVLAVRRAQAARFAAVLLLSLVGQSKQVNTLAVAKAQLSSVGSPCVVLAKLPLSIGFGDGTPMKSVYSQEAAIRGVLRGAKVWLCGPAMLSQSLDADSLRSAIESHQTLLFEQIRFETPALKRADVLITDSHAAISRKHNWRVQVEQTNGVWRVAHAIESQDSLFRE